MSVSPEITKPESLTEGDADLAEQFSGGQLWNMSVGFLGIQFGWGLQMANMSSIFEQLGADAHSIAILWLAAPLTGLVLQPLIGNLSDNTWSFLGRRRPYFLVGAIAAFFALILMPHCNSLWMAAGLLLILESSINLSIITYRAFIGDLLPKNQLTQGFALQSVMVGLGAITASALPWFLTNVLHISSQTGGDRQIPLTVELSFYVGAALFFSTIIWTVLTTPETKPVDLDETKNSLDIVNSLKVSLEILGNMPKTMKQLARVQVCTWFGVFCFLIYFPPAIARSVFGAVEIQSLSYTAGIEWAGLCLAMFNAVCFVASFVLPKLSKIFDQKVFHTLCLIGGGLSILSIYFIHTPWLLLLPMVGYGIMWASIQATPYAILTRILPGDRQGTYQGIFNLFIMVPELAISIGFGWVMKNFLHDSRLLAVACGGACFLLAAILMQFVDVEPTPTDEVLG